MVGDPRESAAEPLRAEVTAELEGARLDQAVVALAGVGRNHAQELIDAGCVRLDGAQASSGARVAAGQEIRVELVDRHALRGGGEGPELVVVFEDEDILVVDKAVGVAAHPGGNVFGGTLAEAAAAHCGFALPSREKGRGGIVHRLDKDTSGLVVLAKTELALDALFDAFREREVDKEYRAIVFGRPRFLSDWIDRAIGRDPKHPERMKILRETGRDAQTFYEVVEDFGDFCHLRCKPKTGRTHQIRVHLSSIDLPLVGDAVYRSRRRANVRLPEGAPDPGRQCLHAFGLGFRHPTSGEMMRFEAPIPADMEELLEWLRAR